MTDETIEQFLNSKDNELKNISILIGNGLGKSHPKYRHAFEFDPDYVFRKLLGELSTVYFDPKSFGLNQNYIDHYNCPEQFFQTFRIEMLFISLMYYIDKLKNIPDGRICSSKLTQFLEGFKSIYTINYDPIIYWNIFKEQKTKFTDYFLPNNEEYIFDKSFNPAGRIPIYYMHGAFHIFERKNANGTKEFIKLENDGTSILEQSKERFDYILKKYREQNKLDEEPTCVMATTHKLKDAWIRDDEYLNFCMDKFKAVKKLLVFGCAFTNDHHLLDAFKDQKLDKLWVCYKDEIHKENLEKELKNTNIIPDSGIEWIDSNRIEEMIW